jgi:hypothetical protein
MYAISCYVELARSLERELVIVPFISDHYRATAVYLEDYFDTKGEWRSLKSGDDTSVMDDPIRGCAFANVPLSRYLGFSHRTSEGEMETFELADPDGFARREFSSIDDVAVGGLRRRFGESAHACVGMLPSRECGQRHAYGLSHEIEGLLSLARARAFGSESQSFRAAHLRRGDRCLRPEATSTRRCKSMSKMPFLEQCRGDPNAERPEDRVPMYIATDEAREEQLRVLSEAGCLTLRDALDGDAAEDAVLAFLLEKELLARAEKSYSFGCSTTTVDVQRSRRAAGLTPVIVYIEEENAFRSVPFDEKLRVGSDSVLDCRAATLGGASD